MLFTAFKGVHYDDPASDEEGVMSLDPFIAPRILGDELEPFNAANLLGADTDQLWTTWLDKGVLRQDDQDALYIYRIGFADINGAPVQVSGVVGFVTPTAAAEPLSNHARMTHVSVNAPGFTDLLHPTGLPMARATDSSGAHHRLWALTQFGVISTICDAVNKFQSAPPGGLVFVTEDAEPEYPPAVGMIFAP